MTTELDAAVDEKHEQVRNPYCRHGDIHAFCPYSIEQEMFASSPAFEVFFGGAAGPGKTVMLLNEGIRQIDNPGYRAIFFRRTYLELDQAVEMTYESFPDHGGRYVKNEHKWIFPYRSRSAHSQVMRGRRGGATYTLAYCERDADVHRYQGKAFAYVGWDEVTQYPNDKPYTYLFLRCRPLYQGLDVRCYIRAASNPGGPGHAWVKERFISGRDRFRIYPIEVKDDVTGRKMSYTRQWIPATLDTNDIMLRDTDYEIALLSYPDPELRRAMRHGDWDIVAGVMFSELRDPLHVEPPRKPLDWTRKEITVDWGYASFAHAVWIETASAAQEAPRSNTYRELVVTEVPPPLFAQMLLRRTPKEEQIERVVLDSSAWATPQDGGPSPAEQMMPHFLERGWKLVPSVKGAGSRVRGWMLLHTYFFPRRRGGPLLRIMKDLTPVLWHQLTSLARGIEPHDVEDIEPHQIDHGADSLRYWAQGRPEPALPTEADLLALDPHLDKMLDPRTHEATRIEELRDEIRVGFGRIPVRQTKRRKPGRRTPWGG